MDVIVRLRKCSENTQLPSATTKTDSSSLSVAGNSVRSSPTWMSFASVIDCQDVDTEQREVYTKVAAKAVHSVATGLSDACILVYGQTGAGKTRTVFGAPGFWRSSLSEATAEDAASAGLLPRSVGVIFRILSERHDDAPEIFVSCAELYQGQIRDLIFPDRKPRLLGNRAGSHNLVDIGWLRVIDTTEFCDSVRRCASHRMTSSTKGNAVSSRSHCFFYVKVGSRVLTIVDLAGSERLAKHSKSRSLKLQSETRTINLSLSWLSHCFKAVSVGQKPPVRESVLTRLLHGAIVGDQYTALCLCVTDRYGDLEETRSTLGFGQLVQKAARRLQVEEPPSTTDDTDTNDGQVDDYISSKLALKATRADIADLQAYVRELSRLCSGNHKSFKRALKADVAVLKEGIDETDKDSSIEESKGQPAVFSVQNAASEILRRLKERDNNAKASPTRLTNSVREAVYASRVKRLSDSDTARTRSTTATDDKHCINRCYELLGAG
ncbi:Chromosome-associated kinesin kif4a [Perkinsus chesapeaki]|uniref:Chromosome-associated kinesin kif4a n=1 Tax=Perkinsus chesapeaki TaxID=330153 RepID=A0A7J6N0C7_PERCH|nr:Chromosome-associated kinesin kif4a [Perkinsus chesapeaki]